MSEPYGEPDDSRKNRIWRGFCGEIRGIVSGRIEFGGGFVVDWVDCFWKNRT